MNQILFRSLLIQHDGYHRIDDVGNPHGQHGRRGSRHGKGRGDGREQNVGEAQQQSDTDVDTLPSPCAKRATCRWP